MERINRNIDIHMCICIHTYTPTFFVFFLSFFFSFTFFPSSFLAFFLVIHFLLFLCWYQGGKIHERKFDTCKVLVYIRQKCYFERGKKGKKLTRTYKVSRILKTLDTSTNVIRAIFSFSIYLFFTDSLSSLDTQRSVVNFPCTVQRELVENTVSRKFVNSAHLTKYHRR